MDKRGYRTYTESFKLEALELLKSSGKNSGQIERDLGITPGLLLKWRNRYQVAQNDQHSPSLEPSEHESDQQEIRRLRREVMEITEEREILKKVVSIFSRKNG